MQMVTRISTTFLLSEAGARYDLAFQSSIGRALRQICDAFLVQPAMKQYAGDVSVCGFDVGAWQF